jgi:predicted dehydrogenase
MGRMHAHAYRMVQQLMDPPLRPVVQVLVGRDASGVQAQARALGIPEWSTDFRAVVAREDLDAVDIAVPSDQHAAIALAALAAKKHVLCEKPLANTVETARTMRDAAVAAGVVHLVGFNYRRMPAMALARRWIEEGRLGRIFHIRATYLQDWAVDPNTPLTWRFRREVAGSGSLGDLLTHLIDLARYLVGEFAEVMAMQETFIHERPVVTAAIGAGLGPAAAGSEKGPVTVDDATTVLARMANGALATFEATRFATGRKNALRMEIHGERGAIAWDLENLNEIWVAGRDGTADGFRRVLATHPDHPYLKHWWPEGHGVGYDVGFAHEIYDWIRAIAGEEPVRPDFTDGLRCQEVAEAIDRSVAEKRAVRVTQA